MYKRILLILIFILSVIILSISIKTYRITKKISHNPNFVTKLILPNNDNPIELVYTDYGFGLFVASKDGTLAALLGASPGASTSVQAMITVIERCFANQINSQGWQEKIKQLVPSYGESLIENATLLKQVRQRTLATLKLV